MPFLVGGLLGDPTGVVSLRGLGALGLKTLDLLALRLANSFSKALIFAVSVVTFVCSSLRAISWREFSTRSESRLFTNNHALAASHGESSLSARPNSDEMTAAG